MKPFLRLLVMLLFAGALFDCSTDRREQTSTASAESAPAIRELLVGTYTNAESKGIYRLGFDPATGKLDHPQLVVETVSPSYLTISKDRQRVFAVNESQAGHVSSFTWNTDRSQLIPVSQQPSQGDYPCYVALNDAESLLAIANYITGNILIFPLDASGTIGSSPTVRQHQGSGPVQPNQKSAHAHCVQFDANGRYLYAVDLGIDQIISYPISETGEVEEASSRLVLDPGDGPRHLVFHPSRDLAFVVNELSGSVVSLRAAHEKGLLEKIGKASTLPEDYTGKNACADIHITANGKFLYASNRGHNSIAIFSVAESGELTRVGIEPVRGDWPRNFTLSPDEKHLLVANQNSNNITVFAVDPATGLLTFTGQEVSISQPVALKF